MKCVYVSSQCLVPVPAQSVSRRSSLACGLLVNSPLLIFFVYVSFIRRRGSSDLKEQIVKERKDDTASKFPPEKLPEPKNRQKCTGQENKSVVEDS